MHVEEFRPPYIEFQRRSVEDRAASIRDGVYRSKEVDFIVIVPHGSEGKTRIEQEYETWLVKTKQLTGAIGGADGLYVQKSRFPQEWLDKIEAAYARWKKGEDMEVEGTPIKNWPVLSPGQVKTCLEMHIQSVEQLAAASDEAVHSLGMGWMGLRQRARDWIKAQQGEAGKLSAQLEASKVELAGKEARIKQLEEQVKALTAKIEEILQKESA